MQKFTKQKQIVENDIMQLINQQQGQKNGEHSINEINKQKQNNLKQIYTKHSYSGNQQKLINNKEISNMFENSIQQSKKQKQMDARSMSCPYISTIRRHLLDYDFQKVCSVSLKTNNVYGCLVCGRYFHGKSPSTEAYEHSLTTNHYMYISLETSKIYCLPDNYEVISHTLADIQFNLRPFYTLKDKVSLYSFEPHYNVDGKQFVPGIVGLNNLGKSDYANSILQLLNTIYQLREQCLFGQIDDMGLLGAYKLFIKKIWNPYNFKGIVNPHELLQVISQKSSKMYRMDKKADAASFALWMIDNLSRAYKKLKNKQRQALRSMLQGRLKTSYVKGIENSSFYEQNPTKVQEKPFLIIRLDFPAQGIFNKTKNEVRISNLLEQYLGYKGRQYEEGLLYMKIIQYPQYLLVAFKRFISTSYQIEIDQSQVVYSQELQIEGYKYTLIGQIFHEGQQYEQGSYKAYVHIGQKWYYSNDLLVKEVPLKQVLLAQPYLQLYRKRGP